MAYKISEDGDDLLVNLAACYFHDIINYPKDHLDRSKSSVHTDLRIMK